jgi:hypothetical protein
MKGGKKRKQNDARNEDTKETVPTEFEQAVSTRNLMFLWKRKIELKID